MTIVMLKNRRLTLSLSCITEGFIANCFRDTAYAQDSNKLLILTPSLQNPKGDILGIQELKDWWFHSCLWAGFSQTTISCLCWQFLTKIRYNLDQSVCWKSKALIYRIWTVTEFCMTKCCLLLFAAMINVLTPHCDQNLCLEVSSGEGGDFADVFALIGRACGHENQSRVRYWVAGCESNTPFVCRAFCQRETERNVTCDRKIWFLDIFVKHAKKNYANN